jgi:hypothetical protein
MRVERAHFLFNPLDCSGIEQERAPLGYLRSGRAVWPIAGAEPDDDSDEDDSDDGEDDDDTSGASGKGSKKGSKSQRDDDDDEDDDKDDEPVSREEFERMRRRMRKADQRAQAAEQALRDKEREGQKPDEQATADLEAARTENATLKETLSSLRLENAFLLSNTVSWHDPELAMREVLKDDDVEIDDEGAVTGLDRALKRLARKKPYLVKQDKASEDDEDDDEDDEEEEDEPPARRQRSGGGGKKKPKKGGADRAKILATYPALNRR